MRQFTILILGSHQSGEPLHVATRKALRHAADARRQVLNTRWMGADDLLHYPELAGEADAVVLAPPGPRARRVLPASLLHALKLVRENDIPLLATGESHGLVYVEFARNVLGMQEASSTWYEPDASDPVVHALDDGGSRGREERFRSIECLVLQNPMIASLYGGEGRITETTDVVTGLNPDYATAIEEAGCVPAMTRAESNVAVLHVLEKHRWHVTAAFLPQLRSTPEVPHPLFAGLVGAIAGVD